MSKYGRRSWGTGGPSPKRMRRSDRILTQASRNLNGPRRVGCSFTVLALAGAAATIGTLIANSQGWL